MVAALGVVAACSTTDADDAVSANRTTTTTIEEVTRELSDTELGIQRDPAGRPYDTDSQGRTTETDDLGVWVFPGGEVLVLDGNALQVGPTEDDATVVHFGSDRLSVRMLLAGTPEWVGTTGVRIDVPGTAVARWTDFELAYGTSGGVGAITTRDVMDHAEASPDSDAWFIDEADVDYHANHQVFDLDRSPGNDSLWFSNGFGDGGFPMSRGLDADGTLVSLVIWGVHYPWRLAIPDGVPPRDVSQREDELEACAEGRRAAEVWPDGRHFCTTDVAG